jgi:hypothetical protein
MINDMKEFEKFIAEMDKRIVIGTTYNELTGMGTEYVVKNGQVIAKFLNGHLDGVCQGNSEKTAV